MSYKYLITGCSGFVGKYIIELINKNEEDSLIYGIDLNDFLFYDYVRNFEFYKINILNEKERFKELLERIKPDYIINLAAISSVGFSWTKPEFTIQTNININLTLYELLRELNQKPLILSVSSSEIYAETKEILTETSPIDSNNNPYAFSRYCQEKLNEFYIKNYDFKIIMTRSFNHIGPYQNLNFVIPTIVKQFVDFLTSKDKKRELYLGNIDSIRDFTDVRDIVRAYYLLLKKGRAGEIYNVCSGKGYSIRDIIKLLSQITGIYPEIIIDKDKIRKYENPYIIGSYEKLNKETGWKPEIDLNNTLRDTLEYWKQIR